jgi:hypothetical protein
VTLDVTVNHAGGVALMAFEPSPAERNFVEVWLLMLVTPAGQYLLKSGGLLTKRLANAMPSRRSSFG